MSGIIPKEDAGSFQRWQIGSFDTPGTPRPQAQDLPVAAPPKPEDIGEPVAFELPTAEAIERIHEEARTSGYQAGYDAGYAEGRQAGEEAAREAATGQAERLLSMAESLRQSLGEFDHAVAGELLSLATAIAAQIVGGTLKVREDALLPVVREAIAALPVNHSHVVLRLHPEDAANIRALLGEQLTQTGTQLVEDSDISPGGCIVRAGSSEIDATIETRWKRVLETIGATPEAWTSR